MKKLLLSNIIEHLEESRRVIVNDIEDIESIQETLLNKGYKTEFVQTDREYLILID